MVEVVRSSFTSSTDSKPSFAYYNFGKKENTHIVNSMDSYNKITENKYITRKASKVSPSEFEDWIQGGENNFTALVNLTTLPRRKKSVLSNVSYSSESSGDEEINDTPPVTKDSNTYQQQSLQPSYYSWISCINNDYISDEYTKPIDSTYSKKRNKKKPEQTSKSSWFTSLFQKQCKKETPTKKMLSISNFFSKKKTRKEQVDLLSQEKDNNIPTKLPSRYPISVERIIYHISNMRLSNSRRPLRHQVMISNMLFQYNSLIQSEKDTLVFSGRLQYPNSYIYEQTR